MNTIENKRIITQGYDDNVFEKFIGYAGLIPGSGILLPFTLIYAIGWNIGASKVLKYFANRKVVQMRKKFDQENDNSKKKSMHTECDKVLAKIEYYNFCQQKGFRQTQHALTEFIPVIGNYVSYEMYHLEVEQNKFIVKHDKEVIDYNNTISNHLLENNNLKSKVTNYVKLDEKNKQLQGELDELKEENEVLQEKLNSQDIELKNSKKSLHKYQEEQKNLSPNKLNGDEQFKMIVELRKNKEELEDKIKKLTKEIQNSLSLSTIDEIYDSIDEDFKKYRDSDQGFKERDIDPEQLAIGNLKLASIIAKIKKEKENNAEEAAKTLAIRIYAFCLYNDDLSRETNKIEENNLEDEDVNKKVKSRKSFMGIPLKIDNKSENDTGKTPFFNLSFKHKEKKEKKEESSLTPKEENKLEIVEQTKKKSFLNLNLKKTKEKNKDDSITHKDDVKINSNSFSSEIKTNNNSFSTEIKTDSSSTTPTNEVKRKKSIKDIFSKIKESGARSEKNE